MKTLIVAINAKYIHSNLAAYSLRAYAMKQLQEEMPDSHAEIEIAEYTINQYAEQILADIYRRKPDLIAVSCYIWNIQMTEMLVPELHKLLPQADIWLGGPEVSYDTAAVLERLPVQGIMVGEGERTFYRLICSYLHAYEDIHRFEHSGIHGIHEGSVEIKNIAGIACREFMTRASQYMDMNELVFPYAQEYMDTEELCNRIVYYESSRGCPFSCAYCLSSIDKAVRLRDVETVKQELDFFIKHKTPQVKFVDRTFNCNHKHAMEIWKHINNNDNGVTNFHFEISADLLSEEELELLHSMRPGLVQLEIGVQSVHQATIEEINRRADFEQIARVVERIQSGHNIHLHLDLIAGLPKEDYDTFAISFNRVYALKPEQLQLGFLKVLKGSPMAEQAEGYGMQYLSYAPYEVLSTKWLSYEDILQLKAVEQMLEMYYNSNQFVNTITLLEQTFADGFSLYRSLAEYYREAGHDLMQPSRLKRYEILLGFAEQYDKERLNLYRESLILDLYLRENLKSRPTFATDQEPYKEQIQAFYRRENMVRTYLPDYTGYDSRQISRMTHVEVFRYLDMTVMPITTPTPMPMPTLPPTLPPIPTMTVSEPKPEDAGKPCYILFDYFARDPLTQNARMCIVII